MHTFCLTDWLTIRGTGANAGATVVQTEQDWLDLSSFQDVNFWVDVRELTGTTIVLIFETSPSEDESLFQPIITGGLTLAVSTTPTIVRAPMLTANVPISRFVRWKLTCSTGAWDVTFRVLVAANSPGM